MIILLTLLTYPFINFTDNPCPSHVNLNRVEIHESQSMVRYGCWLQYQNLKIYIMDDENEYSIIKDSPQSDGESLNHD